MLKRSPKPHWLLPVAAMAMAGCPNEELATLEPCTVAGVSENISQSGTDQVDLLFVIDNSGSMAEEQAKLADQLPRLVKVLTSGDLNEDGEQDFQPVRSLHLGVISSDMGTYGVFVAGNGGMPACSEYGDDGVLLRQVGGGAAALGLNCNVQIDNMGYQTYVVPDNPEQIPTVAQQVADKFACVAALGTAGCGLEQQLEAMLKALTPAESATKFYGDTSGHGGSSGQNKGFLRPDAVLAVIQVSDEEDCSVTYEGRALFDASQGMRFPYMGEVENLRGMPEGLNFRCADYATDTTLVHSVERYVNGLKALKPNNEDKIIFAAIVGVPPAAEDLKNGDVQDFEAILNLDDMKIRPGANLNDLPRPACMAADGSGSASPARRFVQVAQGFGENGVVLSICSDSYKAALDQILVKITKQLTGACLPNPLNPDANGVVRCDVVEIRSANDKEDACKPEQGRVFLEKRQIKVTDQLTEERVVCKVNQVAVKNGQLVPAPSPLEGVNPMVGWYYDTFSQEVVENCPEGRKQRISTTPTATLAPGASFAFECFSPVGGSIEASGKAAAGAPCTADDQCKDGDGYKLACEPTTRTCQILCNQESDCPDGWVCSSGLNPNQSYCEIPTCPVSQQ